MALLLLSCVAVMGFVRDLRLSARALVRTPVWSIALLITIALGIASNAGVDGFVRGFATQGPDLPDAARDGVVKMALLLRVAAVAVFVIACINVASFLLSRAAARSRETAMRVAIGAGRRHLLRQALADSVVIASLGAAAGAVLSAWLVRILPALLFDQDAEQMAFASDWRSPFIVIAVCAAITMLCGLLPLIEMRHDNPGAILQRENSGPSRVSVRLSAMLVIGQMAACTALVISAGLLLNGFRSSLQTTAGRRLAEPVLASVEVLQSSSKSEEESVGAEYFSAIERAGRDIAGATSLTWTAAVPGNRPSWKSFIVESPRIHFRKWTFDRMPLSSRTINTIQLPPIEGRMLGTRDIGDCGGVVISRTAAARLGGEHVIGRSIVSAEGRWADIVGVVTTLDDDAAQRVYHYDAEAGEDTTAVPSQFRIPELGGAGPTSLDVNVVSPNYFKVMGFPIVAGHDFDQPSAACRVAIVNEEAATRYFGGDAVGNVVIDGSGQRTSVIGVVRTSPVRAAQRAIEPTLFVPTTQDFLFRMTLVMETGGVSDATLQRLQKRIEMTPGGRPEKVLVKTLESHLSRTAFAPERIATVLVGASAAIGVGLGVLGLYGVMSDATRRRRREFALRIALGAPGGHIVREVIGDGARLVVAGAVAGVLLSLVVALWLGRIAPTGAVEPWVWLSGPVILMAAVLLASVLPARSAASSDPLIIMRDQ